MKKIRLPFLVLIIVVPTLCSYASESYDVAQTLPVSDEFETEHFIFQLYDDLNKNDVLDIVDSLDNNYERIVNDLAPDHVPKTYVHLFRVKESWLKINPKMPGGGGTVTREHGTDNIWMSFLDGEEIALSIEQLKKVKPSFDHEQVELIFNLTSVAMHEFTHLVLVSVDERIANNPRWLWESVALFEAGQSLDPVKNGYGLKDIQIPFSELENSFDLYMLGYHITDYIVSEWGMPELIQLIKTQGDTKQVLNVFLEDFEKGYWQYLDCKFYKKSSCD